MVRNLTVVVVAGNTPGCAFSLMAGDAVTDAPDGAGVPEAMRALRRAGSDAAGVRLRGTGSERLR